jgi:two-component system NarL family response regulator
LINGLEQRVAERTSDLEFTNLRLQHEMGIRQASQAKLVEQQRALAILDERERVSHALHDGLAQVMSAINLQTQAAQTLFANDQPEAGNTSLESVTQMSQEAIANIRNFIFELREPPPPESDFFMELEEYLNEYSAQTGIETNLSLPTEHSLPAFSPATKEQIVHIIQEALANTRKHAHARKAEVMLSTDERSIHISISDDGIGFDKDQTIPHGNRHFGLKMMRERIEILGGRMEIRSGTRKGTKILAFIPHLAGSTALKDHSKGLKDLRLLLVDDSLIFLEGLHSLLSARGLTVVGTAQDGLQAQEKTRQLQPDIVVMDVMMPRCNGIEATLAIKAEFPEIKIVMLTTSEKEEHLFEAIKNGASGYLLKGTDANEFCATLEKLVQGETILSPDIAARLITEFSHGNQIPQQTPDVKLSERQQQILDLVASGLTYKEVGLKLHLSEKTIKYHMGQILERLHLKNRAQAFAFARPLPNTLKDPI